MNIEWIREQVSTALANIHLTENGQLGAMEEQAILATDRFKKNPVRYAGTGKYKYRLPSCPLNTKQTRAKGTSKPLINETTYHYSSWRRDIYRLPDEMRSWLLYCYGDYAYYKEQLPVVPYIWREFELANTNKRITGKVRHRLQALALLAVQVVRGEINEMPFKYTDAGLAEMTGVSKQSWHKNYQDYWACLLDCCQQLDKDSLLRVRLKN
ncbi:MAG: bacteriophage antitermination protein Q [Providencia heimbachae]|nr:bacteriophage antitermination protein Q [Providencia heimbachae]